MFSKKKKKKPILCTARAYMRFWVLIYHFDPVIMVIKFIFFLQFLRPRRKKSRHTSYYGWTTVIGGMLNLILKYYIIIRNTV